MLEKLLSEEGFPIWSLIPITTPPHLDSFHKWLNKGFHGEMRYMESRKHLYEDPSLLLPGATSILITAVPYRTSFSSSFNSGEQLFIASYAKGRDYHRVLRKRLTRVLKSYSREIGSDFRFRVFVDTAPILERELASLGGLGWQGKNTCLINRKYGSYLFLAGALTNLPPDGPSPGLPADQCGNCRRCIEACPTGALTEPYTLDARKCLSYLTIEYKEMDDGGVPDRHGWLFGCDICQEVCPYNRDTPLSQDRAFMPASQTRTLNLADLNSMDQDAYFNWSKGTPLRRMTWERFKRNLRLLSENDLS